MTCGTAIRAMFMGLTVMVLTASSSFNADAKVPKNNNADLEKGRRIVIVHTNDLHGNIEPDSKNRGGLTRIASLLKQIRKENPGRVVYFDCGDVAQGTPVSNLFHGEPMYKSLSVMKPLAGTLGNHEYDWGMDVQKKMLSNADYPILVANVVNSKGKNPYKPYMISEINGVKLGIIGLIAQDIPGLVKKGNTADLKFLDPAETCLKYIPKMYKDGAELIVAVSHCGVDADKITAEKVPALDLIVGGHSHTKLDKAINVGGHTWIVQAGHYGRYLGQIALDVNPYNGKIFNFDYKLITLDKNLAVEADPEVAAIAEQYNKQVQPMMEKVVGSLKDDLTIKNSAEHYDSSLGNAICDALRKEAGADIGVYNWGGIRIEAMQAGEIKLDTIFRLLPFDDPVVVVKLKGQDIVELFRQSVCQTETGPLQASGVEMVADSTSKEIVSLKINGQEVDPNAEYTVATTEFLSKGGDNYSALGKGETLKTIGITRDVFIDYIKSFDSMPAPAVGRMVKR
ncbi:MAG: bifunctional metallophosphatase/5'-nucleotidase [Candidatus Bruticola sp.]